MSSQIVPNIIIGAGPAGLAVAGRMRKKGIAFEVLEQSEKVGYSWHNHYDRLLLHTVKQFSHLPHLPFPKDYPIYVPREKLVQYFEKYAKEMSIKPRFNQSVNSIKKVRDGWQVQTEKGNSFISKNVVIATGVNRVPHSPTWKGQEIYRGKIIHSREYRNAQPFDNQRVLVVGFGNTGAEVALDLSENNVDVTVLVRSPVAIVPRDVNGRPVQVTAKTLAKIPFGIGDWLGTQIRKVIIGDLSKYGVPMSKKHPAVQLRETGKTPVIDLGTVAHIKAGKIKVVNEIDHFVEDGVVFRNAGQQKFDSIILATGYLARLDDFLENVNDMLDKYQVPKKAIGEGQHKGLYFVGFDNYKLGGILGTIYTDSETIVNHISNG